MSSQKLRVLASYRKLLKSCRIVFDGDAYALQTAFGKIRSEFRANKNENDPEKIDEMVKTAEEAADYLLTNVVQMEFKEETNRYKMKLRDGLAFEDIPECKRT